MTETKAAINARLKRTNIKGKEYIDVAQRIQAFWEVYPNGSIQTEAVVLDPDWCVIKATVYDMDAIVATGHAYEVKGASNINRTSYIENCETSAVGRALGILGIGSTESIASANEVANAISQQAKPVGQDMDLTAAIERCRNAVKRLCAGDNERGAAMWKDLTGRDDFENQPGWWLARALEIEMQEA